jgi:regulatory protein
LPGRKNTDKTPGTPLATALRLLAARPYSVAEMRRTLKRKCGPGADVAATIARLRQMGYLDDRKFADQVASSLARNRNWGPYRVRRELKTKNVADGAIDAAVEHAYKETPERELLERALEKKLRSLRLPLEPRRIAALAQSLMRMGFRSDAIMEMIRKRPELRAAAEEIEPMEEE